MPLFQTHVTILLSGLMVIIIRHFLVDSENVNDNWLMLFDMADEEDEIVVFYTKNHLTCHTCQSSGLWKTTVLMYDLRNAMRERMPSISAGILYGLSDWTQRFPQ